MTERILPESIDASRFALQGLELEGVIYLAAMSRLATGVHIMDNSQKAKVKLKFGVDEQGLSYIKGQLATTLILQCQRCMQAMNYEIIGDFLLGIANSLEQADKLPESYEPVMAESGVVSLRDIVEDELLLSLPIIPKHAPDMCSVQLPAQELSAKSTDEKVKNPFQVLESLKRKDVH